MPYSNDEDERTYSAEEEKYRLNIPDEGVYELEAGTYSIETGAEALAEGEDVEIVEGAGEYKLGELTLEETGRVWIPEGSTLFLRRRGRARRVPFTLTVSPTSGTGETLFRCTITGAKPDRVVAIRVARARRIDPTVAEMTGDGTATVRGDELAARVEGVVARLIPDKRQKTARIELYGQERARLRDRRTARVPVTVRYGGVAGEIRGVVAQVFPGITPPRQITPAEAAEAAAAGRPMFLKFVLPPFNLLPSPIRFVPGMPVLPGFVISETP